MRAVIYARYSSDNQREESIDAQIRAITEYASSNGYTIVGKYIDEALSAKTDNRPRFLQMISDSKDKLFDIVICHKLDRFARNRYDSAFYKKLLKDNNVRLISVLENFDDSPESIILESVLEGMAEYYSANLAREVQKGLKENALECKHTGGKPPFGYEIDIDKKYKVNESEAKAVKHIFKSIINGETVKSISAWLKDNGYKSKYGTIICPSAINDMIRNEKYKGVYVYGKEKRIISDGVKKNVNGTNVIRIPDGVPRIIDDEMWDTANRIFDARKHVYGGKATAKEIYLLSGKIKCSCGRSMCGAREYSGRNKSLRVIYKCTGRKNGSECKTKAIRRDFVEGFVLDQLNTVLSEINLDNIVDEFCKNAESECNEIPKEIKRLKGELSQIDKQLNNAMDFVLSGVKSQTIMDKIDELEQNKKSINDKLHYIEKRMESMKIDRQAVYDYLLKFTNIKDKSDELKKKAINTFVHEVIVSDGNIQLTLDITSDSGAEPSLSVVRSTSFKVATNIGYILYNN